jgi:ABC-type dipeptide/oligopeptide/nickel transport system permease subunit
MATQARPALKRMMTAGAGPRKYDYRFSKRFIFGAAALLVLVWMAALAPYLTPGQSPYIPVLTNLELTNIPPFSQGHLLGTDYLGRDILSEAMWGTRASLAVGIIAATLAALFGSLWGTVSAFAGGIVDTVMMRIVDGLLAIPSIILLLALNSLITTPGLSGELPGWLQSALHISSFSYGLLPLVIAILAITATTWLEAARIARGKILSIKSEEYIAAATAAGVGSVRMVIRHLLPNAASLLLVEATLLISDAILMESGLSYLGLGLGPATPSWGSMLNSGQLSLVQGNWWAVLIPGLLITTTVLAVTLLVEGWLEMTGTHRAH